MHAYLQFVRTEMDKRGWTAAELSRASGLSRQHLSRILSDDRDVLQRRPEQATIDALATAFGVSPSYVLTFVAEAMGFPSGRVEAPSTSALSDDELLRILAERLKGGRERDDRQAANGNPPDRGDSVEDSTQPDGVTPITGERRRRGSSEPGPRLLSDNVDDDVLELPYAADDSEDPGEDHL